MRFSLVRARRDIVRAFVIVGLQLLEIAIAEHLCQVEHVHLLSQLGNCKVSRVVGMCHL